MHYLTMFVAVESALRDDQDSNYSMSGGEETYATWDAYLGAMLGLWTHDPATWALLAPLTEAERWQFAGENCSTEEGFRIANMLDAAEFYEATKV